MCERDTASVLFLQLCSHSRGAVTEASLSGGMDKENQAFVHKEYYSTIKRNKILS